MAYKLTLDLERFVLGTGYYLHTAVDTDPLKTDPVELIPSLLIRLSTATQPDVIARVCTRTDLEEYPEFTLPNVLGLYELSGTSIQAALMSSTPPIVGDDVDIVCPDLWLHIDPLTATFSTTIYSIPIANTSIVVVHPFPAPYFSGLEYTITHTGTVRAHDVDAIAKRYNPNTEVYCRVSEDYSMFTDLSEAINKLIAIRAEAQGLVDDYEESGTEFEGISEEVFT